MFGIVFGEFQLRGKILCSIVGRILFEWASRTFQPNVAAIANALDRKDPASRLFRFDRGIELYAYMISCVSALWDDFSDCDISSMDGLQDGRNL